jgi:glutamyl aminopeptidase
VFSFRSLFRNTILDLACSMDHPKCMEMVGKLFTEWINSETRETVRPTPDLRSLVYYHGMRSVGTQKEWDIMFDIFAKEQDASEKTKLQSALAGVKEPWILRKLIDLASADEVYVRKQDYFSLMASISNNRHGEALVWDYVREKWPEISTRFGLNERNLGRMIPTITSRFTTEAKLNEMKAFFAQYPEAGAGANARIQALEAVQNNINWLAKNQQPIGEWLKQN